MTRSKELDKYWGTCERGLLDLCHNPAEVEDRVVDNAQRVKLCNDCSMDLYDAGFVIHIYEEECDTNKGEY